MLGTGQKAGQGADGPEMDRRGQGEPSENAFSSLGRDLPLQRKGVLAPGEVAFPQRKGKQGGTASFEEIQDLSLLMVQPWATDGSFCFCPGLDAPNDADKGGHTHETLCRKQPVFHTMAGRMLKRVRASTCDQKERNNRP